MKYVSLTYYRSNIEINAGQRSWSRSQGQKILELMEKLVTSKTHMKYESPTSYGLNIKIHVGHKVKQMATDG